MNMIYVKIPSSEWTLRYTVFHLPKFRMGRGSFKISEKVRKIFVRMQHHSITDSRVAGEQAEINFELVGEPPFTFTYQRTELARGQRKPKVLETHTVSGVTMRNYSIYSAAEGTWTVSFIQDKYCRYPPMQVDKAIEDA